MELETDQRLSSPSETGRDDAPLPRSIVIGTAGWSIPRAVSTAFPTDGSTLARYAHRFDGVEINSTFYRSHRASTYARWRDSVPAEFRFAVKMPKVISHDKRLKDTERELAAFLMETAALGEHLGPLLLQLPPKFGFDGATAAVFFGLIRRSFDRPIVVEPRHLSWFGADADALLSEYEIARAGADPPRADGGMRPGGFRGLTYLRLHGTPRVYFSSVRGGGIGTSGRCSSRQLQPALVHLR